MRILIIGANGAIGKRLTPVLAAEHEIITAGRNSGDHQVDITSESSIRRLFEEVKNIDACVCIAASGPMDDFATLTEDQLMGDMKGKLFGQVNVVLIGQHFINTGGSITITSGLFADIPYKKVTGGAMTSGALHSFTLSAALELKDKIRINCVSPGMAADSVEQFGYLFPGLAGVPMEKLTDAYRDSIAGNETGKIYKVYN